MNKKYWFYIDSFVHISIKNNDVLFYNPYTGKLLEFPGSENNGIVLKRTRQLLSPRNLRVIRLTAKDLREPALYRFVRAVREYFMGDLLDTSFSTSKPFQMPPRVKIQREVKYLKSDEYRSVGENVMDYLAEITIYLNDACRQQCQMCSQFYRQVVCCTSKQPAVHSLDITSLKKLFNEIKGCNLTDLNITGGDILTYPYWSDLESLLNWTNHRKIFYVHYLNIVEHFNRLDRLKGDNQRLKIPVTFPLDEETFKKAWESVSRLKIDATFVFIIQDNEEYNRVEELLSRFPLASPVFLPFYNGKNLDFFEENFFIDREDIEENKPSLRDIYINSTVNADNFGKIILLADGSIYANLHASTLGNLRENSLYDCIFKEMKEGRSWRKIRENVLPCKQCDFEKLCPPISNYNIAIGKYDLCHIHPG